MPGMPNLDLPMRPLIVHSASYATTYDVSPPGLKP